MTAPLSIVERMLGWTEPEPGRFALVPRPSAAPAWLARRWAA